MIFFKKNSPTFLAPLPDESERAVAPDLSSLLFFLLLRWHPARAPVVASPRARAEPVFGAPPTDEGRDALALVVLLVYYGALSAVTAHLAAARGAVAVGHLRAFRNFCC